MMGILLSAEEIIEARKSCAVKFIGDIPQPYELANVIAKAQLKKVMDKWKHCGDWAGCKMIPVDEWQALLKEIE